MPESRNSVTSTASLSSIANRAPHTSNIKFNIAVNDTSHLVHTNNKPYETSAHGKKLTTKLKQVKPAVESSPHKLRILGPNTEATISEKQGKLVLPSTEPPHSKFDAVTYFKQITKFSRHVQAGYQRNELGVRGHRAKFLEFPHLKIAKSGIIDPAGNVDRDLHVEKKAWPVALRSLLKLHTYGKIKMMIHVADGFKSDDWTPGYYLRPVFHCDRCHKHFVHSGDIDSTCQEVALPVVGPWFIVGPATAKFVLSVSKMIDTQLDTSRSRILAGTCIEIEEPKPSSIPPKLKMSRVMNRQGTKKLNTFSANTNISEEANYIEFNIVAAKIFDVEAAFDVPNMAALKELALRGLPAYEDSNRSSLYTERDRVEVSSDDLSPQGYSKLPAALQTVLPIRYKHLKEEARPPSSVRPDMTEVYKGLTPAEIEDMRRQLSFISMSSGSSDASSDDMPQMAQQLLKTEEYITSIQPSHPSFIDSHQLESTLPSIHHATTKMTAFLPLVAQPLSIVESADIHTPVLHSTHTDSTGKSVQQPRRSLSAVDVERRLRIIKKAPSTDVLFPTSDSASSFVSAEVFEDRTSAEKLTQAQRPVDVTSLEWLQLEIPTYSHPELATGSVDLPQKTGQRHQMVVSGSRVVKHPQEKAENVRMSKRREINTKKPEETTDHLTSLITSHSPVASLPFSHLPLVPSERNITTLSPWKTGIAAIRTTTEVSRVHANVRTGRVVDMSDNKHQSLSSPPSPVTGPTSTTPAKNINMFEEVKQMSVEAFVRSDSVQKSEKERKEVRLDTEQRPERKDEGGFQRETTRQPELFKSEILEDLSHMEQSQRYGIGQVKETTDTALPTEDKQLADLSPAQQEEQGDNQLINLSPSQQEEQSSVEITANMTDQSTPLVDAVIKDTKTAANQIVIQAVQNVLDIKELPLFDDVFALDPELLSLEASDKIDELRSQPDAQKKLDEAKLDIATILLGVEASYRSLEKVPPLSDKTQKLVSRLLGVLRLSASKTHSTSTEPAQKKSKIPNKMAAERNEHRQLANEIFSMLAFGEINHSEALEIIVQTFKSPGIESVAGASYDQLIERTEAAFRGIVQVQPQESHAQLEIADEYIGIGSMWKLYPFDNDVGSQGMGTHSSASKAVEPKVDLEQILVLWGKKKNRVEYKLRKSYLEKWMAARDASAKRREKMLEANKEIIETLSPAKEQLRSYLLTQPKMIKYVDTQQYIKHAVRDMLAHKRQSKPKQSALDNSQDKQPVTDQQEINQEDIFDFEYGAGVDQVVDIKTEVRSSLVDDSFLQLVEFLGMNIAEQESGELERVASIDQLMRQLSIEETKLIGKLPGRRGAVTADKMSELKQRPPPEDDGQNKINELKETIQTKTTALAGAAAARRLANQLKALSSFRSMIAKMNPNPEKLKRKSYINEMAQLHNTLYVSSLNPEDITADALWAIKEVEELNLKLHEAGMSDFDHKNLVKFHKYLKRIGRKADMLPKRTLVQHYEFHKRMSVYGLDPTKVEAMPVGELESWFKFHKHLSTDYAKVMDTENLGLDEVKDLKAVYDIQRAFKLLPEEASPETIASSMKFAMMVDQMFEESPQELAEISEEEKEVVMKVYNQLDELEPSMLETVSREQLHDIYQKSKQIDSNIPEIIKEIKKTKPRVERKKKTKDNVGRKKIAYEGRQAVPEVRLQLVEEPGDMSSTVSLADEELSEFYREAFDIDISEHLTDADIVKLHELYHLIATLHSSLEPNIVDEVISGLRDALGSNVQEILAMSKESLHNLVNEFIANTSDNEIRLVTSPVYSRVGSAPLETDVDDVGSTEHLDELRDIPSDSLYTNDASRRRSARRSYNGPQFPKITQTTPTSNVLLPTSLEHATYGKELALENSTDYDKLMKARKSTSRKVLQSEMLQTEGQPDNLQTFTPFKSFQTPTLLDFDFSDEKLSLSQLKRRLSATPMATRSGSLVESSKMRKESLESEEIETEEFLPVSVESFKLQRGKYSAPKLQQGEQLMESFMGTTEAIFSTPPVTDEKKRNLLKELLETIPGVADKKMKRWRLLKSVIKQIDNLKKVKEKSMNLHPQVSERDVWLALIMAKKNVGMWRKLKRDMRQVDFNNTELDRFSVLVGIPTTALEAIMAHEPSSPNFSADLETLSWSEFSLWPVDSYLSTLVESETSLTHLSTTTLVKTDMKPKRFHNYQAKLEMKTGQRSIPNMQGKKSTESKSVGHISIELKHDRYPLRSSSHGSRKALPRLLDQWRMKRRRGSDITTERSNEGQSLWAHPSTVRRRHSVSESHNVTGVTHEKADQLIATEKKLVEDVKGVHRLTLKGVRASLSHDIAGGRRRKVDSVTKRDREEQLDKTSSQHLVKTQPVKARPLSSVSSRSKKRREYLMSRQRSLLRSGTRSSVTSPSKAGMDDLGNVDGSPSRHTPRSSVALPDKNNRSKERKLQRIPKPKRARKLRKRSGSSVEENAQMLHLPLPIEFKDSAEMADSFLVEEVASRGNKLPQGSRKSVNRQPSPTTGEIGQNRKSSKTWQKPILENIPDAPPYESNISVAPLPTTQRDSMNRKSLLPNLRLSADFDNMSRMFDLEDSSRAMSMQDGSDGDFQMRPSDSPQRQSLSLPPITKGTSLTTQVPHDSHPSDITSHPPAPPAGSLAALSQTGLSTTLSPDKGASQSIQKANKQRRGSRMSPGSTTRLVRSKGSIRKKAELIESSRPSIDTSTSPLAQPSSYTPSSSPRGSARSSSYLITDFNSQDSNTSTLKLPAIQARRRSSSVRKSEEEAEILDKIANGDASPAIISAMLKLAGVASHQPVTLKNRKQIVQILLKESLKHPQRSDKLVSAVLKLIKNLVNEEPKPEVKTPKKSTRKKRNKKLKVIRKPSSRDSIEFDSEFGGKLMPPRITVLKSEDEKEKATPRRGKSGRSRKGTRKRPKHSKAATSISETSQLLPPDIITVEDQSLEKVISRRFAVERVKEKLKAMIPVDQRKAVKKVITSSSVQSLPVADEKRPNPPVERIRSEQTILMPRSSNATILPKKDTNMEMFIPTLPKYEGKSKSRIGAVSARVMASSGTAKRLGLASYDRSFDTVEQLVVKKEEMDVKKFLWIYEWDLYEPYFTRNWTFTYHPVVAGYREHTRQIYGEGKTLGPWLPELTVLPEYPSRPTTPKR